MSELILDHDSERERDYGIYTSGVVEAEDRNIEIAWRKPSDTESDVVYVMANGWTGAKASMRLPAHEAAKAGYNAVTFGYTNKGSDDALEENTKDMVAVINAMPENLRKRAIGISMGGRVGFRAMAEIGDQVESYTGVASAGFIDMDELSTLDIINHFAATSPELFRLAKKNPRSALYVGATTLHNCVTRGRAVAAEIGELVHGNEHDKVHEAKDLLPAPFLRFYYGNDDKLLPRWAQKAFITGLPIDHVVGYDGGHMAMVDTPVISQNIFKFDEEVTQNPKKPLPVAA
jgi:pimeloyl-ACP methyl ester carboxylesterase